MKIQNPNFFCMDPQTDEETSTKQYASSTFFRSWGHKKRKEKRVTVELPLCLQRTS